MRHDKTIGDNVDNEVLDPREERTASPCWRGKREVGEGKGARGSSKIKLKNVNKKRMATARRLIFWNFSRHPLLI